MDLMQTADQDAIQQTVRSFLEKELPMERVRKLADGGGQQLAAIWRAAAELGFFGLGSAEAEGGAGYSLTEEMVLFEELGRFLAPGPWLGSVLAAHALSGGGAAVASWRKEILAGERAVVTAEYAEGKESTQRVVAVEGTDGEHRITGFWKSVADAPGAGALLVLGENGVFFVPAEAGGVEIVARPSMEPTRAIADVRLRGARCFRLATADAARLRLEATVLACAAAVGGIQRTVEMSVEYAKVRHQFDKPIGSFQAVKHRCADMAVRAEVARSSTIYATVAVRDATPEAAFHAAAAKLLCANAYLQNAADNVQNHGGMGFTWECDAHLFVKRARAFDLSLGSRTAQLDSIVAGFRSPRSA